MKILLPIILAFLVSTAGYAASAVQHEVSAKVRAKEFSVKKQLMLQGYDVVSYQQEGGPKEGSRDYQAEYKGVLYYFVSEANKATFLAEPERYEPLYGGWCAYAMLDGEKTEVNPESYKVVEGRLLVFYDGFWGDTLKLWNEFEEQDSALIKKADAAWETILK
ncbi:MAG: YHS domain-containing (seleno)protein [Opitutaceae bacterium]